jgi:hypothetical protein
LEPLRKFCDLFRPRDDGGKIEAVFGLLVPAAEVTQQLFRGGLDVQREDRLRE